MIETKNRATIYFDAHVHRALADESLLNVIGLYRTWSNEAVRIDTGPKMLMIVRDALTIRPS